MPKEITIPQTSIDTLLEYVKAYVNLETQTEPFYMHVDQELQARAFDGVIELDCIETAYIYAHSDPIPLHVDRYKKASAVNLCVPLMKGNSKQFLLVFDQEFVNYGLSWRLANVNHVQHKPAGPIHQNSSDADNDHLPSEVLVGVRPCDTPGVTNITPDPIPQNLKDQLPYGQEDFYHGMSGIAWDWRPGVALAFKSSQIHCTGAQNEFKIGCVLLLNSKQTLLDQSHN